MIQFLRFIFKQNVSVKFITHFTYQNLRFIKLIKEIIIVIEFAAFIKMIINLVEFV